MPATFVEEAAFLSRVQLISMFAVVVLGVLAMGLMLARAITNPITKLVQATESGDCHVKHGKSRCPRTAACLYRFGYHATRQRVP